MKDATDAKSPDMQQFAIGIFTPLAFKFAQSFDGLSHSHSGKPQTQLTYLLLTVFSSTTTLLVILNYRTDIV